ncbi:MAG: hypothetical protein ACTHQM_23200 [Thermoanaerobaculia bacterium]
MPANLEYTVSERFRASLDADRDYAVETGNRPRLDSRWYVTVGGAYSVQSNTDGTINLNGTPKIVSSRGSAGRLTEVAVGRYFRRIRVEVSAADVAVRYGELGTEFGTVGVNSDARTNLVIGRLLYDIRRAGPIQPYVGVGIGHYSSSFRWIDRELRTSDERSSGVTYEIESGVAFPISPRTALVPSVRYLATEGDANKLGSESMLNVGLYARLTF